MARLTRRTGSARHTCSMMIGLLLLGTAVHAGSAGDKAAGKQDRVIPFAKGQYDKTQWTPLLVPGQKAARSFIQQADCLATAFTHDDVRQQIDNVLLVTDTHLADAEFEVTFSAGDEPGTAPGLFIWPTEKDGVLHSAIAVFVASSRMAVWKAHADLDKNRMLYDYQVQLAKWSAPNVKHVLRCRYSKRGDVALQLDRSDVLVFRFSRHNVHPTNSRIGIWGCHGTCKFYQVKINAKPVLGWQAADPNKKH